MEHNERYTDKLAKLIIAAAGLAVICALCWYFRSVLSYILIAVVVSLIAKPLMRVFQKINIKGRKAPDWLLAATSLVLVLGALASIITVIIPIISSIVKDISLVNIENAARSISAPLSEINSFLIERFPSLGEGFRIEVAATRCHRPRPNG